MSQAIPDYNKAIEINPNFAEAYCSRGDAYDKQNNLTQAIADYTKALEINPNFVKASNNLAISYYKLRKNDKNWVGVYDTEESPETPETTETPKAAPKPAENQIFAGTVVEVLLNNNPMYGNRSEIIAIDSKGQKMNFVANTGIAVLCSSASTSKTYTLKTLKKGDRVTIEYITNKEGLNRVVSIELIIFG